MTQRPDSIKFYTVHVIVAVITLACLLMNGPMRGGLPLDNTVAERMAFIASNGLSWSLSWFVWMLSAIGLFVFCAILADELDRGVYRTIGIGLVGMGIAPDLIAEVTYAFIIPEVIARQVDSHTVEVLEIIAIHLTGFLGNGLYNLGGLLLTCLAISQGVFRSWVALWGISAWILGLLLSLSVAIGALKAAELFTASSMVLSTAWMLVFAWKVLRR
jgi:hypothetical protein